MREMCGGRYHKMRGVCEVKDVGKMWEGAKRTGEANQRTFHRN